ncbi:unnamed protein product [Heterobilharzia americana]|nr:unnamed protein product [Heterobilharzia americana]
MVRNDQRSLSPTCDLTAFEMEIMSHKSNQSIYHRMQISRPKELLNTISVSENVVTLSYNGALTCTESVLEQGERKYSKLKRRLRVLRGQLLPNFQFSTKKSEKNEKQSTRQKRTPRSTRRNIWYKKHRIE